MTDIVDCCRVWESHLEVEIEPWTSADRRPVRAICQVTVDEQTPAASPETETLEDIIRKLLQTPALPPPKAGPDTIRPGSPHPAIDGSDMPTTAGGTGAIVSDRIGNHVAKLASGRNSHGGGRCFAESAG